MELISFILPLYNKAATINRAISSIVNQNNFDMYNPEIVIVNDGSTDNSLSIIDKSFLDKLSIYSINNSGVSVARNFGVSKSKGHIIFFLDCDDELLDNALNLIYSTLSKYPDFDFYSGSIELTNENGISNSKILKHYSILNNNFYLNFIVNPFLLTSSSSYFRRDFFNKFSGFPESFVRGEDIYLWLLMGLKGKFYSSKFAISRIYRNAVNRSANVNIANLQLPYFLTYFLLNEEGLRFFKKNLNLRLLIYWLSIKNMLGFKELGIQILADKIVEVMFKYSIVMGSIFYLFSLMPIKFISHLRALRN